MRSICIIPSPFCVGNQDWDHLGRPRHGCDELFVVGNNIRPLSVAERCIHFRRVWSRVLTACYKGDVRGLDDKTSMKLLMKAFRFIILFLGLFSIRECFTCPVYNYVRAILA